MNRLLAAIATTAALMACSSSQEPTSNLEGSGPGVIVCGADISRSMRTDALAECRAVLASSPAAARVVIRYISGTSFSTDQLVADLLITPVPDCQNPWDVQCHRERQSQQILADSIRAEWLERIDTLPRPRAPSTDIYGFVVASVLHVFEHTPEDAPRRIVLVTDLVDTAGRETATVDLSDIAIDVRYQSGSDPEDFLELRRSFTEWARSRGASDIQFRPLSSPRL